MHPAAADALRRAVSCLSIDAACPSTAALIAQHLETHADDIPGDLAAAMIRQLHDPADVRDDPEDLLNRADAILADIPGERWLYHGTPRANLPDIARDGLLTGSPTRTGASPRGNKHRLRRLFLTDCELTAAAYALAAATDIHADRLDHPEIAVLRLRADALGPTDPDPEGLSGRDRLIDRPVPPDLLEVAAPPLHAP